eukprot:XP_025010668.1 uncharacterized protein LOC107049815 isoform X7 [Gallus gallus]
MEHLGWQPQRDCLFLEAVSCGLLGEPWSLERVLSRRFWTPGLLQRDVRTPLRTLMDTAGSHSQRWTPTSTLDLVCQGAPLGLCVLLWPGRCGAPTVRRVQTLSRTTEERGCPGFSDPNAACSALTNCDAKRRGRLQNRLLDWRLHHQVLLSFLTSLGCGVGHALILRKGRQWRVVTLSSAARTLWRHLVDAAGTHSQRWMPRCTPSSVWQALLTCEVVPTLAEVLRAWCWLSLVLTLLSPGVLPLAIFRAPQFWWDLRAFCLSQRTWTYPPHGDAFPDLLDCSVGCALILGKGWHWRVVTLLSSARTLLRLLVDTARTHTRKWMPISIPSSVWQALLSPEVIPMLAEELPLASMSRSGQADVVCQWIKAFRIQPKEMGREAALGLTKSKCSLMESNSSLTNTHPVCPRTSWLRAPQF